MNLLKPKTAEPASGTELVAAGHFDRHLGCWVDALGMPVLSSLEWTFA